MGGCKPHIHLSWRQWSKVVVPPVASDGACRVRHAGSTVLYYYFRLLNIISVSLLLYFQCCFVCGDLNVLHRMLWSWWLILFLNHSHKLRSVPVYLGLSSWIFIFFLIKKNGDPALPPALVPIPVRSVRATPVSPPQLPRTRQRKSNNEQNK